MSQKKRLAYNTTSSFIFQVTTIICGFILPRLILSYYGSEVNGLVNSITQFLSLIGFLELGVGAVIKFSLYKPLAEKNSKEASKIVVSGNRFFRRIAMILTVYVIILIIVFPYVSKHDFDFLFTATLIGAMSISSFAQYYFGIIDRILLTADQHGYIQYTAQTITLVINTAASTVLIYLGASIQLVKLVTSLFFLVRPIVLRIYVNRHYGIDRKIKYDGEPIKQKWNGIAQHVASVILDATDNIILTLFSTFSNVSIYSVYNLVVNGIKVLMLSMTNGMQAILGELWAKQNLKKLNNMFGWFEWAIHTGVVLIFGCTGVLLVPFVRVYTSGIHDAQYIQPLFSVLIVCANAGHCLRLPYNIMILAAGHFKQTQRNYIIAAVTNIVLSVVFVNLWGIVGVAIGTLAAMVYQTVWMAVYISRNIIKWPLKKFLKQVFIDAVTIAVAALISQLIPLTGVNYFCWAVMAAEVFAVWTVVVAAVNMIFYRQKMLILFSKIRNRLPLFKKA